MSSHVGAFKVVRIPVSASIIGTKALQHDLEYFSESSLVPRYDRHSVSVPPTLGSGDSDCPIGTEGLRPLGEMYEDPSPSMTRSVPARLDENPIDTCSRSLEAV